MMPQGQESLPIAVGLATVWRTWTRCWHHPKHFTDNISLTPQGSMVYGMILISACHSGGKGGLK